MPSGVHTFFTHCEWEEGASSSFGWQRLWRSGRSNRRCEPPQIGPHDKRGIERDLHPWQRSNTVGLEHLTKGQQRGFARLSGCVDWAKALDKGGQIELKIYLHAFSDSVNCQTAGNSIIQNSRLAIIGFHSSRPQRVGINKRLGVEKQVQALKSELDLDPEWWVHFNYIKLYYSTNTNTNAKC